MSSLRPAHPAPGRRLSDPLAAALLPPPNETQAEREGRLRAEQAARSRSENIDKMLRDSARQGRKRKVVKVLLLGQSESGKSTTLKRKSSSSYLLAYCRPVTFSTCQDTSLHAISSSLPSFRVSRLQ